ncbi:transcriptional regulator, AraC family [Anaeromyxobacter dehalogenans 2CP-1]|uniref:Transcriptional regulator, AraC family n=1 Tax=Anaeromyxobacter dehalogenans (strain ATCC BAA-258 / DSM 21875 / 2CP-1) TaxID=455488 RepID=B8JF63_ANAD2|nr:AraC family transcriptional regulator [Anaeromyxobacter dehalogenans]ACL64420.1 transcriptional regulator, AraC family [Anaeromyxobacter dehalogenans 2CP-1]
MTIDPPSPSDLEAFEEGREPLRVTRLEAHARRAGPATRRAGGGFAHAYAVVVLLTAGRSRVEHAGALELRPGDVHVIPPGDAHSRAHFEDAEGYGLAFWPEESGHSLRLFSQVRGGCHPVLRPPPARRRRIERWLRAIEEEASSRDEGRDEALAALLRLVLLELVRASAATLHPRTEGSSLARRALAFVEGSALRPLSLSDVARAVGRTPAHVATVVRSETGRTVGEWILAQRMAEARLRLRATGGSVEAIAGQVGYADVTHFIRQFRRVHGRTPAQWRRVQGLAPARRPRPRRRAVPD